MASFGFASTVLPRPQGGFLGEVTDAWFQGPGAYGGLTGGLLLRGMSAMAPRQALRTATLQFCAPVTQGAVYVDVHVERKNLATTFLSARLAAVDAPDRVLVHGIAAFGQPRSTDLDLDGVRPPALPEAEGLPSMPTDGIAGLPVFLQHYDLRFAAGAPPYTGASSTDFAMYLRPREPEPVDAALALGLLDAVPPAALARADRVRRMASLSLHLQILRPLPDPEAPADGFWLVTAASEAMNEGFADQTATLFSPTGQAVAVVRQLFALV